MKNQNLNLKIGDKIGFTFLASDIDDNDKTLFFPVVSIMERDGETAYFIEYPDGTRNRSAIKQSDLAFRPVQIEPVAEKGMICLSSRKDEFKAALKRGLENDLHVEADCQPDTFLVVNRTNNTDYRVKLETRNGLAHVSCECRDFQFRRRLCKHICEVLQETFFGVADSFGVTLS